MNCPEALPELIYFCRKIGYPMVSGDSKNTIESMQAVLRKVESQLADSTPPSVEAVPRLCRMGGGFGFGDCDCTGGGGEE